LSHKIETGRFAKFYDFGMNGNNFISPIVNGTGKLVANVDAQTATVVQHAKTFRPNYIQIVDITFVTVVKPDLVVCAVVFQLPVGWRSDYQMNAPVVEFAHLTAVAIDYDVLCIHFLHFCKRKGNGYFSGTYQKEKTQAFVSSIRKTAG
jgi:hypothetical protein